MSSCRKSWSLCPKEVFFVKLCKSGGLLLPSPRSLIPWPTLLAHSCSDDGHVHVPACRKSAAEVKFIVSLVEWKLQFGLVRFRINPRRCETWLILTRSREKNCRIPDKGAPDFSRQVLRSAWGQTESKIRFGSGPGRPKLSDGSAAIFDSIFDLEPSHGPKPSNRTEIRFAKPL